MSTKINVNHSTNSLEQRYQELYTSGCQKLGRFTNLFTGKDPRDTALILASTSIITALTTILTLLWLTPNTLFILLLITPPLLILIDTLITLHYKDAMMIKLTRLIIFYLGWEDRGPSKVPAKTVLSEDRIGKKAKKYLLSQNYSPKEKETFYTLVTHWEGNLESLITLCKNLNR